MQLAKPLASALATLSLALGLSLTATPLLAESDGASRVEQGREIAFDRRKGNCLACHAIGNGASPGTIGPPLSKIAARYPDRARLHAQLWDATRFNPNSPMPPFGAHGALSNEEIELIIDFLLTI
jgi:sulfur-oxidizing protein SoxX